MLGLQAFYRAHGWSTKSVSTLAGQPGQACRIRGLRGVQASKATSFEDQSSINRVLERSAAEAVACKLYDLEHWAVG